MDMPSNCLPKLETGGLARNQEHLPPRNHFASLLADGVKLTDAKRNYWLSTSRREMG